MLRFLVYGAFRLALVMFSLWLVWLLGLLFFIRAIPVDSSPEINTPQAQAIVVFTGTPQRIHKGVALQEKLNIPLLISGVKKGVSLKQLSITPSSQTTLGRQARDTEGNAKETYDWLTKNHVSSFILVTSNYHVPRSLLELRRYNKHLDIIVLPTVNSDFLSFFWWKNTNALKLVIEEYNKYVFALARSFFQESATQDSVKIGTP